MHTLLDIGLNNAVMILFLALPAAAVSRWCRRPALAHGLWLLVFLKLLTPPVIPVSTLWPSGLLRGSERPGAAARKLPALPAFRGPTMPAEERTKSLRTSPDASIPLRQSRVAPPTTAPTPSKEPVGPVETSNAWTVAAPKLPSWWLDAVSAIWVSGSVLWFSWIGIQAIRFQRLLRHAVPAPLELQERAKQLALRLRLRQTPTVWLVAGNVSPMIWALGLTPRVLFPAKLLADLGVERTDALLAHELAHVRRGDHWVRFFEVLALGLYWWHPVAWWARHELREAEEQCCDAWVVWLLAGAARSYALALLQTVEFFSKTRPTLPMAASGIGQVTHLRRRLTMIMQGTTPRSLSLGGCLLVMGVGTLLLIRLPLQAQQPASAGSQREKSSTDEQINALKHAIDVLQQQKSAEQKTNAKEKAADVERLRSVVVAQEKRVKELRLELARAEGVLGQVRERLERLSGIRKEGAARQPLRMSGPGVPVAAYVTFQEKPGSFEERLDRILKEIDDLRKEIRGQKPAGAAAIDAVPSYEPPMAPDQAGMNHAAYNNEAWNIAISADTKSEQAHKALELAHKACEMTDWKNGYYLDTLAAAHARLGQFDEAVKWQEKALEAGNLGPETEPGRERLKLYKDHKPYNQTEQ